MSIKVRKSTIAIVICLTVAAICFGIAMMEFYPLFQHTTFGANVIDFEHNKKDFQTIVGWLSQKYGKADVKLPFTIDKERGICKLGKEDVPEELVDEFLRIEEAFGSEVYLEYIKIRGRQISFCLWGQYDIVYSPIGRPRWVHHEDDRISAKKISGGWYYVKTLH